MDETESTTIFSSGSKPRPYFWSSLEPTPQHWVWRYSFSPHSLHSILYLTHSSFCAVHAGSCLLVSDFCTARSRLPRPSAAHDTRTQGMHGGSTPRGGTRRGTAKRVETHVESDVRSPVVFKAEIGVKNIAWLWPALL